MADGMILHNGTLVPAFIYEGERVAVEYPDGKTVEIPSSKIHMVLRAAVSPNGEPCHVLYKLSPITRLPIVVLDIL